MGIINAAVTEFNTTTIKVQWDAHYILLQMHAHLEWVMEQMLMVDRLLHAIGSNGISNLTFPVDRRLLIKGRMFSQLYLHVHTNILLKILPITDLTMLEY